MLCEQPYCTGCAACYNICPSNCITMREDDLGFKFPYIDLSCCTSCSLCTSICPMLQTTCNFKEPLNFFAVWNKDIEICKSSASGGFFQAIASEIILMQGTVIGAAFDDRLNVRHVEIESLGDLPLLSGSKYMQSDINDIYKKIRQKTHQQKTVLFSGTPCQVDALYSYLGENPPNLLTCDLICHGVPAQRFFQEYLRDLENKWHKRIVHINQRHKKNGWSSLTTQIRFEDSSEIFYSASEDPFMIAFLKNLTLGECCFSCKYASPFRTGDITMGDFWGSATAQEGSERAEQHGISLVITNTEKGVNYFRNCSHQLHYTECTREEALSSNHNLNHPTVRPDTWDEFLSDYRSGGYAYVAKKWLRAQHSIKQKVKRIIVQIIGQKNAGAIRNFLRRGSA